MPNSNTGPAATVSAGKRGKVKKTLFPDSSQESAGTETRGTDDSQDCSQNEFVECTPVVKMTELASSTDVALRRRPSGAASADGPRLRELRSTVLPSPRTGESSSSQAREVGAVDPNIVEHTEFTQRAIQDASYHRAIRRSHPRLYLHSRRCLKSVCLFEGIDDGTNIAKTGVVWRYDEVDFEVVTIVSSGYVSNNTKSSKLDHAVPIYVILRNDSYIGCTISWDHLRRVMVSNLFADGTPHAQVNLKTLHSEDKRLETFLRRVDGESWRHVEPYESRSAIAAKAERARQHAARAAAADKAKKKAQDAKIAARQQKHREKQAAAKRQEAERARRAATAKKTRAAAERRNKAEARRRNDAVDKAITARLLSFDAALQVRLSDEIAAGIKDAERVWKQQYQATVGTAIKDLRSQLKTLSKKIKKLQKTQKAAKRKPPPPEPIAAPALPSPVPMVAPPPAAPVLPPHITPVPRARPYPTLPASWSDTPRYTLAEDPPTFDPYPNWRCDPIRPPRVRRTKRARYVRDPMTPMDFGGEMYRSM